MKLVTVAVCTYNRCKYIRECIKSIFSQEVDFDYDVLLINNNSTDETGAVVSGLQQKHSNLQYVFEAQQGLSYARNRALKESESDFVIFLDDDAFAEPGWLSGLVRAYQETKCACVSGRIEPAYPGKRPEWVPEKYEFLLGKYGPSPSRCLVQFAQGGNFGVNREAALSVGAFDTRFGFVGGGGLAGEETEFCQRLTSQGHEIVYEPSALVMHTVEPAKLNAAWFRRRAYISGKSEAAILQTESNRKQAFGNYVYCVGMLTGYSIRFNKAGAALYSCEAAFNLGKFRTIRIECDSLSAIMVDALSGLKAGLYPAILCGAKAAFFGTSNKVSVDANCDSV